MPIATERVTANSRSNRPGSPPISSSGRNTATSDRLMESTVNPTSRVPCNAACSGFTPASRWREMFSSTTMASSTTKPVAIVRAISDRLLRLNPHRYMAAKVPISETGTATAGISVARPERRNRKTTRITSATEITSVCSTSSSEARMVGERSWAICRSIAAGMVSCRSGRRARMLFTVSIMLASGSLRIISKIAGLALVIPALRTSCTESVTLATSLNRTAAPLL
ncbi:Uncharacterised protein [Enterobacter cloacae]|nr:Uncharacterised protein [Enterobacter cloacae]